MEKPTSNLHQLPLHASEYFGSFQHLGSLYTIRAEPLKTISSFYRINLYDGKGENCGFFLGSFNQTSKGLQFTASLSRNFANSYQNPQYRSVMKHMVKNLVNSGAIWRSDSIPFLSDDDDNPNLDPETEEMSGRNARHLYETLEAESKQPESTFMCAIEDNRYVLTKK